MIDPYEVLGVAKDATQAEIKKAYRAAAKKAHPDSGGSPEAFKTVELAGSILLDAKKRAKYDKTGSVELDSDDEGDHEVELAVVAMIPGAFGGSSSDPITVMAEQTEDTRERAIRDKRRLEQEGKALGIRIKKFSEYNAETSNTEARGLILCTLGSMLSGIDRRIEEAAASISVCTRVLTFLNGLGYPNDPLTRQSASSDIFRGPTLGGSITGRWNG